MIIIVKRSKTTGAQKVFRCSIQQAQDFIYDFTHQEIEHNDIFIGAWDTEEEINEILAYFNQNYLIENVFMDNKRYYINNEIRKRDRIARSGARVNAIERFCRKIETLIPDSQVESTYFKDEFKLTIKNPFSDILIFCTYELEIINSYATTADGEFVDLSKSDQFVKIVNRLFKKQRYYYRQKKKNG